VRLLLDNNLSSRLVDVLPQVEEDLRLGSIVVIDDDSLRIRRLPIG
jgi:predicted nuclease of predicted toxin-antitoxin system